MYQLRQIIMLYNEIAILPPSFLSNRLFVVIIIIIINKQIFICVYWWVWWTLAGLVALAEALDSLENHSKFASTSIDHLTHDVIFVYIEWALCWFLPGKIFILCVANHTKYEKLAKTADVQTFT